MDPIRDNLRILAGDYEFAAGAYRDRLAEAKHSSNVREEARYGALVESCEEVAKQLRRLLAK